MVEYEPEEDSLVVEEDLVSFNMDFSESSVCVDLVDRFSVLVFDIVCDVIEERIFRGPWDCFVEFDGYWCAGGCFCQCCSDDFSLSLDCDFDCFSLLFGIEFRDENERIVIEIWYDPAVFESVVVDWFEPDCLPDSCDSCVGRIPRICIRALLPLACVFDLVIEDPDDQVCFLSECDFVCDVESKDDEPP